MYAEPPAGCRGASPQGASSHRGDAQASPLPQRYREERVRLPADEDTKLAFLRKVIDEGERRGWKLISAVRDPGGEGLLVTWDASGSSG